MTQFDTSAFVFVFGTEQCFTEQCVFSHDLETVHKMVCTDARESYLLFDKDPVRKVAAQIGDRYYSLVVSDPSNWDVCSWAAEGEEYTGAYYYRLNVWYGHDGQPVSEGTFLLGMSLTGTCG